MLTSVRDLIAATLIAGCAFAAAPASCPSQASDRRESSRSVYRLELYAPDRSTDISLRGSVP